MKNKFYITTSIAYVNAAPHIGYALELVQADVIGRVHHQKNEESFLLTGTDEHGVKVEEAARAQGKEPADFVREMSEKFKDLARLLNIGNKENKLGDFIRTDDRPRHEPGVNKMWEALSNAGKLYKGQYKGLYCVGHEGYIKESELENGLCPIHKTRPEVYEEENWFFKLTDFKNELRELYETDVIKIYPANKKKEILNMLEKLEDISFSRPSSKLKWGFQVPNDPTQTIYVWADALTNYISALGYGHANESFFEKLWPADVQVIGKDILKFHTIYWPAMLMAIKVKLPKSIYIHGFINVEGEKMSKSLGNVVDPFPFVEKYGADVVRYFLMREIPSDEDGDFSEDRLKERYTSDLANGLGNLVQRVATLVDSKMDGEIIYHEKLLPDIEELNEVEDDTEINQAIENFKLHEALALIWKKIDVANAFVNEEAPWKLVDENPEQFQKVMLALTEMVHHIAWNLEPFMPETAAKIRQVFGDTNGKEIPNDFHFVIKKGAVLFPRLG